MKVRFIGETSFIGLVHGQIYDVLSVEKSWYRIADGSGEDYLYHPMLFEVIQQSENSYDCLANVQT
jgi:hypothetical protein